MTRYRCPQCSAEITEVLFHASKTRSCPHCDGASFDSFVRAETCTRCGEFVTDWVDPDWAGGRICRPCESKWEPKDVPTAIEPAAFSADPQGQERPSIGQAIMAAVEAMAKNGELFMSHGSDPEQCIWGKDASAKLEDDLCPLLGHAMIQPLQFEWIVEYFTAVQLVAIEQQNKTLQDSIRETLAVYIQMACGQLPWPKPPKDEETETTGGASAS